MIRRAIRPAVLLAALLATAPATAETVRDSQLWANATVIGTIGDRLAYFVEAQPRTADGLDRLNQLLLRGALGWKFSDRVTAYGGYLHLIQPIADARDVNEERLFGQISWTMAKPAGGTLSSRTRIEHRRRSNGDGTGWRGRVMLRYVHPLGDPDHARALVWAEPFVAFNDADWGQRKGFDQLRSFAGFEIPLPGRLTMELGYMNQRVNEPAGRIRSNNIASLTLFIRP